MKRKFSFGYSGPIFRLCFATQGLVVACPSLRLKADVSEPGIRGFGNNGVFSWFKMNELPVMSTPVWHTWGEYTKQSELGWCQGVCALGRCTERGPDWCVMELSSHEQSKPKPVLCTYVVLVKLLRAVSNSSFPTLFLHSGIPLGGGSWFSAYFSLQEVPAAFRFNYNLTCIGTVQKKMEAEQEEGEGGFLGSRRAWFFFCNCSCSLVCCGLW